MRHCLGCGTVLAKPSQRVYCSVRCQQSRERSAKIALWLASGEGVPGTHGGHYIRIFIAEEQDGCCDICGIVDEWNGARLAFVLDHVDGDPANNARANLRLICPNCDSQLPTFKGRNRGNGRFSRRQRYADGRSY